MSEEINTSQELFKKLAPLQKTLDNEKDLKATFGTSGAPLIKSAFLLMKSQLGLLSDGEDVIVCAEYKRKIIGASELTYVIAIERPITKTYKEIMKDFLPLMDNWNKQLGKSKKMRNYVLGTHRILECATTMTQTISMMRHLLRKLKNEVNYRPPAFENSKHYLQSLQEDIEKLDKENEGTSGGKPTTCEAQEKLPT